MALDTGTDDWSFRALPQNRLITTAAALKGKLQFYYGTRRAECRCEEITEEEAGKYRVMDS